MTKATQTECTVAVKSGRVVLVNGAAYLDGSPVRAPRIAKMLETAYWEATRR